MAGHEEDRRRRNAKRLLWVILLAAAAVLAVVAYTSMDAPPIQMLSPEGAAAGAADGHAPGPGLSEPGAKASIWEQSREGSR